MAHFMAGASGVIFCVHALRTTASPSNLLEQSDNVIRPLSRFRRVKAATAVA